MRMVLVDSEEEVIRKLNIWREGFGKEIIEGELYLRLSRWLEEKGVIQRKL